MFEGSVCQVPKSSIPFSSPFIIVSIFADINAAPLLDVGYCRVPDILFLKLISLEIEMRVVEFLVKQGDEDERRYQKTKSSRPSPRTDGMSAGLGVRWKPFAFTLARSLGSRLEMHEVE